MRPKTTVDVFNSPSPAISVVKAEFGEAHLRAFMVKILNDMLDFFSVGKTMGAVQVAQTADLIIEEYYMLKPDDFKLCFNRAKKGQYGKIYDRIDGQIILEWLAAYWNERAIDAADISVREASEFKHPSERTSSLLDSRHEFDKYDFKKRFDSLSEKLRNKNLQI